MNSHDPNLRVGRNGSCVLLSAKGKVAAIHFSEVTNNFHNLKSFADNISAKNFDQAKKVAYRLVGSTYTLVFRKSQDEKWPISLVLNGVWLLDMPVEVLYFIMNEMQSRALKIGNDVATPQLIEDQAILLRLGHNVGLTDNQDVIKEAFKEAQWGKTLRTAFPALNPVKSNIVTQELIRTPTIKVGTPPQTS